MPAARPIRKTLAEVLGGIRKVFGKKVWEMPEAEFIGRIKEQKMPGFYLSEHIDESYVQTALQKVQRLQQRELGSVAPGFHYFEEMSKGSTRNAYWVYNTAAGEVGAFGSAVVGAGAPIRGEIMAAKMFRGKGSQGLPSRISRQMFMSGAIESPTLSTAGAKAYHRQVSALAEEAGLATSRSAMKDMVQTNAKMAAGKVHAAQPQGTPSRIARSVVGNRGSRHGRSGGNG